eukprot:6260197-Amphidinium_carterae.1
MALAGSSGTKKHKKWHKLKSRFSRKALPVRVALNDKERLNSGLYSKEFLENRMCVALGGRIAEELLPLTIFDVLNAPPSPLPQHPKNTKHIY